MCEVEVEEEEEEPAPPQVYPTPRAELGERALECLAEGRAVDDSLLVEMIMEYIG